MARKRTVDSKVKVVVMMKWENFQKLKENAAKNGARISDTLDAAVGQFLRQSQKNDVEARIQRFLNPKFSISTKKLKAVMEEDYYEQ